MSGPETKTIEQPRSLGDHCIPEDRAELIRQHIAMLSETALAVSDTLPFSADVSDLVGILEADGLEEQEEA